MDNEAGLTRTEPNQQPAEPKWHHRLLHPAIAAHTFFATVHRTFTETNHAWVLNQTFTKLMPGKRSSLTMIELKWI